MLLIVMLKTIFQSVLKYFPWILVLTLVAWMFFTRNSNKEKTPAESEITHDVLLEKIEALGKLELVKYNFKEITEMKNISKWKMFFKYYSPDMKAALITSGEAVGCLDLTKMTASDFNTVNDTLWVTLPQPELCYYKLDIKNSRFYSLETGYFSSDDEEKKFVETIYKKAEKQIEVSALDSGILEETKVNAEKFLKPFLEEASGKVVYINYEKPPIQLAPKK